VISRETIELTFLTALQHLPPRQRAVLILSDVLGWSAREVTGILEMTVAAVNSALQRARSTMRAQLLAGRHEWVSAGPRSGDEQAVLQTFMDAWERADAALLTDLLREDARWAMPPAALWFDGRPAIERLFELYPIDWQGGFRMVPTAANRQPAAAAYLRPTGESEYRLVPTWHSGRRRLAWQSRSWRSTSHRFGPTTATRHSARISPSALPS
jgi:RNA polymerase sigma-70 factor (ECF subfamily)